MARVKCRCGETLTVTSGDPDRLTCPRCGAKIRVRRSTGAATAGTVGDGFVRFQCPCGRRLKVRAEGRPEAGKCPDCNRVVPVPESAWVEALDARGGADPHEIRTADMEALDLERLEQWASRFTEKTGPPPPAADDIATTSHQPMKAAAPGTIDGAPAPAPGVLKMEAGLRVCPRCGKPLHMSATVCRSCGEPVPKR